jgi:hypothetical protein
VDGTPVGICEVIDVDVPRPRHPDAPALFEVQERSPGKPGLSVVSNQNGPLQIEVIDNGRICR